MAGRLPQVQQEVAPTGPRVSGPVLGNEADVSSGLQSLGRAAAAGASLAEKFAAEADTVRITESLVELERRSNERLMGKDLDLIDAAFEGTSRTAGFLQSRGTAAGQSSKDVIQGVDDDVRDIADKLLPRQREAFMTRAQQLQLATERRITEHVVRESERAKVDVMKAAQSETIRAIGEDPGGAGWIAKSTMVEESIRALASSPEAAEAAVSDWKGQVALQQISSFLKSGDTTEAQARFAETRQYLGTAADDVEALLKRAQAGDDKKRLQVEATAQAQTWLKEATPAGGYVDASRVLMQLQATPADDPRREALEVEVRQALQIEAERRKADTAKHREVAWRADLAGKALPGTSFVFLEQFDPDFLRGLRNEREARWKRLQADQDGTKAERAAAKAQQAQDDMVLFYEYAALSPEEQAKKTPEEFARELAADRPDFSPSAGAIARTRAHQTQTTQRMQKGDLTDEQRFIEKAKGQVVAQVTRKGKLDPQFKDVDVRTVAGGRAAEFFRAERAKLGRDPTPAETEQWLGQLKVQEVYESGVLGDKKGPAVLSPKFMPGGYGAPNPKQQVAPGKSVRMKFPNGKEYDVTPEQMEAARRKGAVPAVQEFPEVDLTR